MQLIIKNSILNGKEYLENSKYDRDLTVEEIQIKKAPTFQRATKNVWNLDMLNYG